MRASNKPHLSVENCSSVSQLLHTASQTRLTNISSTQSLRQKTVAEDSTVAYEEVLYRDDYICCINAFDNSSLSLGLLVQIKADSREGESLEELGGLVFIK